MFIDKEALQADLRTNVVEVIFTKLNGETRKMRATLSPQFIPKEDHTEVVQQLLNEDAERKSMAVWDIDANGWRSFRVDRVISVQGVNTV